MRFARNLRPVSLPYMFASGKHVFLSVHVKKILKRLQLVALSRQKALPLQVGCCVCDALAVR